MGLWGKRETKEERKERKRLERNEKRRKYQNEMRKVALDIGNCTECFGHNPDSPIRRMCPKCRKKMREINRRNKK